MSAHLKFRLALMAFCCLLVPTLVFAHQPRVVESRQTTVADPEISKAYYGQLKGVPDVFTIRASSPFPLYVNILVPDIAGQKKDVSATILKDGKLLATLDGGRFAWTKMFEPFGYDSYWTGPEYKARAEAGTYVVTVSSPQNDSQYSLAIGEAEVFDFPEIMNALTLVPKLKKDFFHESPLGFILSPFGWGIILILYALAFAVGFLARLAVRMAANNSARSAGNNIGWAGRLLRLAIAMAILAWAVTTSWSLPLIFLSGLVLFEAVFSWCALFAAFGKSSCPR